MYIPTKKGESMTRVPPHLLELKLCMNFRILKPHD